MYRCCLKIAYLPKQRTPLSGLWSTFGETLKQDAQCPQRRASKTSTLNTIQAISVRPEYAKVTEASPVRLPFFVDRIYVSRMNAAIPIPNKLLKPETLSKYKETTLTHPSSPQRQEQDSQTKQFQERLLGTSPSIGKHLSQRLFALGTLPCPSHMGQTSSVRTLVPGKQTTITYQSTATTTVQNNPAVKR